MTNAAAVFGDYENFTRNNEIHLGNPHYYPSDNKELKEDAKRTTLNPKYVDLPQRYEHKTYAILGGDESKKQSVVPESLESLMSKIDSSGSSKYNESWPATEPSVASSVRPDETALSLGQAAAKSKEHSVEDYLEKFNNDRDENRTMDQWNSGTLSRFVQRFREQPPLPRTQRSAKNGDADFWWLSSPPSRTPQLLSSTPKSQDSSADYSPSSNSLFTSDLSKSSSLFTAPGKEVKASTTTLSPLDESESDVARMQMRTDKLLNLTESQIRNQKTSSIAQSPHDIISMKPDQDFTPGHLDTSQRTVPLPFRSGYDGAGRTDRIPAPTSGPKLDLRPEDDILYKWRLSRKMNLASQRTSELKDPFLSMNNKEAQIGGLAFSEKGNVCQSEKMFGKREEDSFQAHPPAAPSDAAHDDRNTRNEDRERLPLPLTTCNPCCCSKDLSCIGIIPVLRGGSSRCNQVPPHTHDECDILPCMHNNRSNNENIKNKSNINNNNNNDNNINSNDDDNGDNNTNNSNNSNRDPVSEEMHNLISHANQFHLQTDQETNHRTDKVTHLNRELGGSKSTHEKSLCTEGLQTVENVSVDHGPGASQRPTKDVITPVIDQVVGAHLFDNDATMNTSNDTLEAHDSTLGTATGSLDINQSTSGVSKEFVRTLDHPGQSSPIQPYDDSSDGEFSDDEILREMRSRRLRNKQELKLVCERLQLIQDEKKRNEDLSKAGKRITK